GPGAVPSTDAPSPPPSSPPSLHGALPIYSVPVIDGRAWRLAVTGAVRSSRTVGYDDLAAFPPRDLDAVIDCTGGWWSEQRWSGIGLADLVAASAPTADASRVSVVSVTGHRWSFGLD